MIYVLFIVAHLSSLEYGIINIWILLYHYFYALSISLLRQMLLLIDIISSYTFFFSHCVMGMTYFRFFYQTLISEAPDAMTPAPLSASWLKSNLLRPQEFVSPDRNTPLLPKETLDSPFRIPQSASALETVKGHWTEQADPA